MKIVILLIEAGVGIIALYITSKYILFPIMQYGAYYLKRAEDRRTKSPEELKKELEAQVMRNRMDDLRAERSDELVGRLDSVFEEARRHQPRSKTKA